MTTASKFKLWLTASQVHRIFFQTTITTDTNKMLFVGFNSFN